MRCLSKLTSIFQIPRLGSPPTIQYQYNYDSVLSFESLPYPLPKSYGPLPSSGTSQLKLPIHKGREGRREGKVRELPPAVRFCSCIPLLLVIVPTYIQLNVPYTGNESHIHRKGGRWPWGGWRGLEARNLQQICATKYTYLDVYIYIYVILLYSLQIFTN